MQNSRLHILSVIAAFAFLLRLLAIYHFGPSLIRFGDAPDYLSAAASLCSTGSYPDRSSMPFFRAPGLPFFIVATTLCHTSMVWIIKIALAVLDSLSAVLIYLLADEFFANRPASLLAAAAAAIYPFFIAQVTDIQTESLFMFLFLAAVWSALQGVRTAAPYLICLSGVCAGAAALVRPTGLVLLLLLWAWFIAGSLHRSRSVALLTLGAVLCLGPWILRNELHFHEFITVNDAGGYNLWRGTSPEMAAIDHLSGAGAFTQASVHFETVTSPARAAEIDRIAQTPSARSQEWYRQARADLAADPRGFASRLLHHALAYWRPWLNPQTNSTPIVVVSGLIVSAVYLFGLIGWNILRRRDRRLAYWCLASAVTFWILQVPFQVVSRFRIPITDPFLLIFSAAAVIHLVSPRFTTLINAAPATPHTPRSQ